MATDKQFLALQHIWIQKHLSNFEPSAFMVWIVLKMHENIHTHKCYPSKSTIAKLSGLSVSTVKRSLHFLEDNFFIEIDKDISDDGIYHNIYKMNI